MPETDGTGSSQGSYASASEVPAREIIAPQGDVIFVVGKDEKEIQIQSEILKLASPVFAAMLGPNFMEGQRLLSADGHPVSIALPDDNAQAFTCICRVLHWCNFNDATPTPACLLEVALLAEKYDMEKPLRYATDRWIRSHSDSKNTEELWKLVVASHYLGLEKAFEQSSHKLLLLRTESFMPLVRLTPDYLDAFKLVCTLEEMRTNIRIQISRAIIHDSYVKSVDSCKCSGRVHNFERYMESMRKTPVWNDPSVFSLQHVFTEWRHTLGSFSGKKYFKSVKCPGSSDTFWSVFSSNSRLHDIEGKVHGFCLKCFDKGRRQDHKHGECS